ncbi:MAG: hypothetical protein NVS3B16_09530 [Vulcanimicrobiaceae bacterium]
MGETVIFAVGETSRLRRVVTSEAIAAFAQASTDTNPMHLDDTFAATTRFGKPIAHGMLAASYISAMLGTQYPGPGTIYMGQTLKFIKPVFAGDTLDVVATVTKFRVDKAILTMDTTVTNQHGDKVVTGECVCLVADLIAAKH